jgi:hypothetical protein
MRHTRQDIHRLFEVKVAVPQAFSYVRIRKPGLFFGTNRSADGFKPCFQLGWVTQSTTDLRQIELQIALEKNSHTVLLRSNVISTIGKSAIVALF